MTRLARRSPEILAAACGIAWFLVLGGGPALDPGNLDWLGGGDPAQHLLGWLFFRGEPWALPLGRIRSFAWPIGTTTGFTDSNPLVSLLLKPFSPLLPRDFQFIGPWLALCFALQGWFGARLAGLASPRPLHRVLGGALFALSPVLAARLVHDTLCAHFALLALLVLHLAPAAGPAAPRRSLGIALALTALFCAVHPYLAVMLLALSAALLVRLAREGMPRREVARGAVALLLGPTLVFLAFGYLTTARSHAMDFGDYSADLLALFNSWGRSRILPALPGHPRQLEGYAYLGAGALALAALAAALLLARGREIGPAARRRVVPLAAACSILAIYALSSVVTFAGRPLLDLREVYRPLSGLTGPFRTSGRFVWPLVYLVLAGAVMGTLRLLRHRPGLASLALGAAVGLQAFDLSGLAGSAFPRSAWRLRDPAWTLAAGRTRHLVLYPAQIVGVASECRGNVYSDDGHWVPFAYEAYALGATFNSGQVARGSGHVLDPPCRELRRDVERGSLRTDTVYVVHPAALSTVPAGSAVCGTLDGWPVCVAASRTDPFREALARSAAPRAAPPPP